MNVTLGTRTEETVRLYFEKTNNAAICRFLPQKAKTAEEAVEDYRKTLLPGATSYGKTILADGVYVGDVWCYCIDMNETPNAMVSYCVFEPGFQNCGIATEALRLFMEEILEKFGFRTVGAFTFSDNVSSVRVLEKNHFQLMEEFVEDGAASKYFEMRRQEC